MAKQETAFGLLVVNGRIACVIIQSHAGGRYKLGRRHGFTPAQVEQELKRPAGPRYRPDTKQVDCEDLTQVSGVTEADQAVMHDRGIVRVDMLAPEDQPSSVKAGMLAYFQVQREEESRRRLVIRRFRERVAQEGLSRALKWIEPDSEFTLGGALREIAGNPDHDEAASFLRLHLLDTDPDSFNGDTAFVSDLKKAHSALVGSPGNRKPSTLADGILEALSD